MTNTVLLWGLGRENLWRSLVGPLYNFASRESTDFDARAAVCEGSQKPITDMAVRIFPVGVGARG